MEGGAPPTAEEVLLSIQGVLNATHTRAIDLFRKIDVSGDGSASAEEFRAGLAEQGFQPSGPEFAVLMERLDKDGSGDVTLKELSRALNQVEASAKAEGRRSQFVSGSRASRPSVRTQRASIKEQERREREEEEQKRRQELQAPMDHTDEVLCKIKGVLNGRKTRMIDVFRLLDKSGDGSISAGEFHDGLSKLGVQLPDDDLALVVRGLDKDGGGDVSIREFDKALKLAERKARAAGRSEELDTWTAARGRSEDRPHESYNWSRRSVRMDGIFYSTASSMMTPRTFVAASAGPTERCLSERLGCGSIHDSSCTRQRILDTAPAPGSVPPSLHSTSLYIPGTTGALDSSRPGSMYCGRFGLLPVVLPHEKVHATRDRCPHAERSVPRSCFDRGVQKFPSAPMMQSTVDQVVFNHDIDMSGDSKFDVDFTSMFDGARGLPSWHGGGR